MLLKLITTKHYEDTHQSFLPLFLTDSLLFPVPPPPSPSSYCAQSPGEVTMCHSSKGFQMNMLVIPPSLTSQPHLLPLKIPRRLHDLRGSRSSGSRDDHEMKIFFPLKTFSKPLGLSLCFFSSVSINQLNNSCPWCPTCLLAEASLPTHDCAFLSLSWIILPQTNVVPLRRVARI